MFGLREEVRGDPKRISHCGQNDRFRWPRGQIDRTIAADKLLGGGNKAIARPEDFIDASHTLCAVGQSRDGLCAAHSGNARDSQNAGGGQKGGVWPWANRLNVADVNVIWTDAGRPSAAFDPRQIQFGVKLSW